MRTNGIMALLLICSNLICTGQSNQRNIEQYIVFPINLNDTTGSERTGEDYGVLLRQKRVVNFRVKKNIPFKISLVDTVKNIENRVGIERIIQSPGSVNENEYSRDIFIEKFSENSHFLKDQEKLTFLIFSSPIFLSIGDTTGIQQVFEIIISTETEVKSNDSFLMVSAIKSIYGEIPQSELFDMNAKFKFTDAVFSLLSMDMSLVARDSVHSSFITEAMLNINRYFTNRFNDRDRKFFFGGGMKIFDSRLLYGAHIGSIELDGPFYSSYVILGYYWSPYPYSIDENAARIYPRNIYLEVAFTVQSENFEMLKNLRIKVGFLSPLKLKDNSGFNYLSRVVLEFPIGGLFRY